MSELFNAANAIDSFVLAHDYGIAKAGERFKFACVACDSSDAMHAYKDRGAETGNGFKCYACGYQMSNVNMVMSLCGVDKLEAAKDIADRYNIPYDDHAPKRTGVYLPPRARQTTSPTHTPTQQPAASYTSIYAGLTLGPQGAEYLRSRGIPAECAEDMGVRSIESLEQWRALLGSLPLEDKLALGLTREDERTKSGYRAIMSRAPFLVLPYVTHELREGDGASNEVHVMRFAPFGAARMANGPKYLSPYGQPAKLPYAAWMLDTLKADDYQDGECCLCITEGEINALSVQSLGFPCIATAGAQGWRAEWLGMMAHVDKLYVLIDGDKAGREWHQKIVDDACAKFGFYRGQHWAVPVEMPKGKDANDLLRSGVLLRLLVETIYPEHAHQVKALQQEKVAR